MQKSHIFILDIDLVNTILNIKTFLDLDFLVFLYSFAGRDDEMNDDHDISRNEIRVLIVDDHAMVRQGLRTFLELQDGSSLPIVVAGEATNGNEAVELARVTQPDIVLLDLVMPEMNGIQAISQIIACSPRSRVIILTSFGEEDKVLPAIRAGAQGYLLKDIPPNELVHAVRETYLGRVQLHPEIAKKLIAALAETAESPTSYADSRSKDSLTEREQEVLDLIANGLNNREIGDRLFISEKTVKTHVSNILGKLGLADRTQAAIYALRREAPADKN